MLLIFYMPVSKFISIFITIFIVGINVQKNAGTKVLLLSSGGVDSTALLDFYLRTRNEVECLHFQYGQKNAKSEKEAFNKILSHYKVNGRIIDLGFVPCKSSYEVSCRNALFVLIAASINESPLRLALGIHEDSRYYDCSRRFIDDCQKILDGYFAGTVRVEAPFIGFKKSEIIVYCKNFKVPTNLTYSCLRQNSPPCGQCPACLDNKELYEG
jgi:7-cyano-7-deazaguanine synthase